MFLCPAAIGLLLHFFLSMRLSPPPNFISAMCFTTTDKNTLRGFLLFLCFSLILSFSSGAETITANQSLSGDQTIISKGENFELGFFKAGNSSNYYIGSWYKKVASNPPTIVWVANRQTPISDRFNSELKIIDGNLVVLNESKSPIWSTNVTSTTTSDSVIAVLLDDGNLVLREGSNSTEPIWQSFDHPAHTWLPGGKMAYNNRTGERRLLTSWKSTEDPAIGLFSMELDPFQKQYISKWNNSVQYWTSGPWNGRIFSLVPEMRLNYIYNFSYIENENESYFTYSLYNPSIISRFIMDFSGQVQQQTWLESSQQWNIFWSQPRQQCEVYGLCGPFGTCTQTGLPFCNCLTGLEPQSQSAWIRSDFSSGCVRKTNLCGRNAEKPGFVSLTVGRARLPQNPRSEATGSTGECRNICLNTCSCNAYSYDNNTCMVWDGEVLDLSENSDNGIAIYIKVASKDLPSVNNNNGVIIGAVAGSVAGVVLILGLILVIIYRRRLVGKTAVEGSLISFVYRDLQTATKNFSEKLGGGGFGSVFKGTLPDSTVVAVKKLESVSQGEKQFRTEVSTIGTIQHVNLVRLRGFCSEGNNKLLVYDYMANGSLDSHLFIEKDGKVLDWKTRYQIALGTARGLVYLHEKCRDCIIHCDIKPENILLDADFCPKVADFGLAKLVGRDFSRVLTTMRGTRGYLAPEWLSGLAVTAKADVYSYGMMLFEIVYGKRNSETSEDGKNKFFPTWAASVLTGGGDILSLLDSRLNREASVDEVTKICKVACWCIQDDEESRPSMSQVEQILEGVLDVNMPPVPRSLQLFVDNTDHVVFYTESSSSRSSKVESNMSSGVSQAMSPKSF